MLYRNTRGTKREYSEKRMIAKKIYKDKKRESTTLTRDYKILINSIASMRPKKCMKGSNMKGQAFNPDCTM